MCVNQLLQFRLAGCRCVVVDHRTVFSDQHIAGNGVDVEFFNEGGTAASLNDDRKQTAAI